MRVLQTTSQSNRSAGGSHSAHRKQTIRNCQAPSVKRVVNPVCHGDTVAWFYLDGCEMLKEE